MSATTLSTNSASGVLGREQPRVWTKPLRPLTCETTRGFEAIQFAEDVLNLTLTPWQKWVLIHGLELMPDGTYRFQTVIVLVARQNGKTMLLKVLSLYKMLVDDARFVLGVAQNLDIAREAWQGSYEMLQDHPRLASETDYQRRTNGDEHFRLRNGARYKIAAANRSAGRGLSIDQLNLDELREQRDWAAWSALSKTTMARRNAQIWAFSNAGDEDSVVLNALRSAAVAAEPDPSIGLFEYSATPGCALDDVNEWAQANPNLGYPQGIREQAIRSALATDPVATFRTEVLCQSVEALDGAIDMDAWRDCTDAGDLSAVRSQVVLCLDVAPLLDHVTLVAAGVVGDRVRVEVVDQWTSTDTAVKALPGWLSTIKPKRFGWFSNGPAAALDVALATLPKAEPIKPGEVFKICQGFAEAVTSRRLLHNGDALLGAHAAGAQRLASGDGWRFTRRGAGHVDAIYAAAGAVHLARQISANSKGRPGVILPRSLREGEG